MLTRPVWPVRLGSCASAGPAQTESSAEKRKAPDGAFFRTTGRLRVVRGGGHRRRRIGLFARRGGRGRRAGSDADRRAEAGSAGRAGGGARAGSRRTETCTAGTGA